MTAGPWEEDLPICPRTDEFHADSELGLDLVEGCRLVATKIWSREAEGVQLGVNQSLNMGTYSGLDSQQSIIQSLLNPTTTKRGGKHWSSAVQWTAADPARLAPSKALRPWSWWGERLFVARYSALSDQTTVKAGWKVKNVSSSVAWFTSVPSRCLQALARLEAPTTAAWADDVALVRVDHERPSENIGLKVQLTADSPVVGASYSTFSLFRKLWAGVDFSYFLGTGAVLKTFALKKRFSDALTVTSSVSVEPNFDKPIEEGLLERVYNSRVSAVLKLSNNVNLVANALAKLGPSDALTEKELVDYSLPALHKRLRGLGRLNTGLFALGFDVSLTKMKMVAELNTAGAVKSSVFTADGFVYSGQIDLPNDNYKFGFGYEMTF